MHKNFSEWYRLVSIEPNGDTLTKRWAAVEEWASTFEGNDENILDTVRTFFGVGSKEPPEAFVETFREHDPAFPRKNELELRVLAGAALLHCIGFSSGNHRSAIISGIAVESTNSREQIKQLNELTANILSGFRTLMRHRRKRLTVKTDLFDSKTTTAINEGIRQIPSAGDINQLRSHITPIIQSLVSILQRSEHALDETFRNLRCADEEIDVLWWMEGGHSRDSDKPWNSLLKESVPFFAAKELADLTNIELGPLNVHPFIHKIVGIAKCKAVSIETYVNSVPNDWIVALFAGAEDVVSDLTPISFALDHRNKSNSSSWQTYFEAATGLSAGAVVPADEIGCRLYAEVVLLRMLSDAED